MRQEVVWQVADHLGELLLGVFAFGFVGFLFDEVFDFGAVAAGIEQDAAGGQSVAACSAGFLVVAFDVLGEVGVDDEADVGLVDAHAKGDGGDDDLCLAEDEGVLVLFADLVGEAGVVGEGLDVLLFEFFGDLFAAGAGLAVDDAFVVGVALEVVEELFDDFGFGSDVVGEVFSFEAAAVQGGVSQGKLADDVFGDAGGGGGGERHDGDVGEAAVHAGADLSEHAVLGPEVVAPLADAVCFVDGEARDFHTGEPVLAGGAHEAFGGEVDEVEVAVDDGLLVLADFVEAKGGVDEGGGDAVGAEDVDLVLHQGDER